MVMGPLGGLAAVWVRWDEVVAGCYTEGWRRRGMDQSISGRVPDTGSWHGGVVFGWEGGTSTPTWRGSRGACIKIRGLCMYSMNSTGRNGC